MTDIEIANQASKESIINISKKINCQDIIETYGNYKAKIAYEKINSDKKGKLILVTAINPTPYGEGKTTVSIGLLDALCTLNKNAVGVLREPSLGPVFGIKGGATGGGYSQVVPMADINLNFTGDLHAITTANNLLAAAIDNHIKQGNKLNIDLNEIKFKRCLDMNDRALKNITINESNRSEGFDITAASEVMAIFCLAKDIHDLKTKLGNILIAYDKNGQPLFAKDLQVHGAMTVVLKDALKPNLVQTLENNPVIIHGGPFANIAHGCNSIIATNTGLKVADYVVTEAGFGSDLGALKFFDIKSRLNDIYPDTVVLVVTTKALKYNGEDNIEKGIENLNAHLNIMKKFTNNIVVCINKYSNDLETDLEFIKKYCENQNIDVAISEAYTQGGKGAIELAKKVVDNCNYPQEKQYLYNTEDNIEDKIDVIIKNVYGANKINYSEKSILEIKKLKNNNLTNLPICIAKTQYSLSANKDLLGYPKDFEVTITNIKISAGAGFITVFLGNIMTMPGLPKMPSYEKIDIDESGNIIGIF